LLALEPASARDDGASGRNTNRGLAGVVRSEGHSGGVVMRVLWPATVLVLLALVGYTSSRTSAQTEGAQAAIMPGEKVILAFDVDRSGTSCTVLDVRGDFVGCRTEGPSAGFGRTSLEHWYNLRLVARIDRPAK
jgi:hypothetical protein